GVRTTAFQANSLLRGSARGATYRRSDGAEAWALAADSNLAGVGNRCRVRTDLHLYCDLRLVLLHVISCGGDEDRLKLLLDDVQDGATEYLPCDAPTRWLRLAVIDRYFDWGQRPAARSSARWASRS